MVFCLSFLLLASLSQQVRGESVVPTVDTKVTYTSGTKTISFVTQENTLANALSKHGIKLAPNDITEPSLSTALIGNAVESHLISAVPVLINDNGQSWIGQSAYTETSAILKQLKVPIDKADKVKTELILDPVTENMAGQMITIRRAPVYTVYIDGRADIIHSWKTTVTDVLADGAVSLNQNDTVIPERSSLAPVSGQIEVTRVNFSDIEETVPVAYETVTQNSYEMYKGQTSVTQEGQNGSKKQTVHVVYHNGVEVSREVISSTVIVAAQNKVVLVGVKPYGIDDLWPILVAAGEKYGVDPGKMARVMLCESGGNQYSGQYGSYKGLFQWDGSFYNWATQAGYPNADIFDVYAQIYATALRVSQNGWGAWGDCQYR